MQINNQGKNSLMIRRGGTVGLCACFYKGYGVDIGT